MTKAKILLAEDDPTLVEMYSIKFSSEGYELLIASDGVAALELAKKEKPAAILLDIMMPKMDGFAVLVELKKDPLMKEVPVLLLSNLGQESDITKGKKLGAVDYVVKASLTPTQVFDKVMQVLTRKS